MSNIAQPNYSEALKEIKEAIRILSNEVSEIKTLLFRIHDVKEKAEIEEKMYPWNFPNVTTTANYGEED
tara:strand:+ start:398 stop:604 length:207 start_codon:yes stop_codon:yes gene_type:complete